MKAITQIMTTIAGDYLKIIRHSQISNLFSLKISQNVVSSNE
jgi:hypothetical protein